MAKETKRKLLFTAIFLSILLIYSAYAALIPNVHAEEIAVQEKALTILNDVAGLDTAKYRANLDLGNPDLYLETLPQENLKYTLESDESKLEVICAFVNENLRSMSVYILDGSPHMIQPATNTLEMAKAFINKYQTYSGASYYGMLRPMLDNVEADKSVTKTSGNAKLEATVDGNSTSFRWTYMINGVEAPSKCVALYFEQGFLKHFIDTWDLYKIGSTDINLSKEEAVKIAMDRAKNYSWRVGVGGDSWIEVTEFNIVGVSQTTLDFGNYISKKDARGGDPLTLYPGWRIHLYFDKLYPGNVYGLNVGVWADTGEVHDIRTMFTLGAYPPIEDPSSNQDSIEQSDNETSTNLLPIAWIALPISIAIVLGATIAYSKRKKRMHHALPNMPRSNSLKLGGALCLLISLTMFSMAMPTVKAGTYGMSLYGSRTGVVWDEQVAAMGVISSMDYYFSTYAGYTCYNRYGSQTQRETVLYQASAMEQAFDHVAMFHHGHAGFDYISNPQILKNGDFEIGASYWTLGGYGDHRVTSEDRHSGSYSLLLGYKYSPNVANSRDWAYQLITIPSYATNVRFSFWYHLFTEDSVSYDWFEVYVAPVGGYPSLVFKKGGLTEGGLEEYGWSKVSIDLSAYAGQSIYVYFAVANWYDTLYKTWCYIDDVTYEVLHWDYLDDDWNINNPSINDEIWDYDVYPQTWRSKTFFVILWACRQGDVEGYYDNSAQKAVGMPYAWHRPVSSGDCFIGFKDASMPLTQVSEHHSYVTYNYWLIRFVYHATYNHRTVMQALDQASIDYFGISYSETELGRDDGFWADWPEYPGWPEMPMTKGWMKIYGNPNIYLY
jgi:hypothetical protein